MRILQKSLNITFSNTNTEEQIVKAMVEILAYNLAENDKNVKFEYGNINSNQNSHKKYKKK